jgi:hypothetical protein
MSCWNFLCGPASPQTPASRGQHQQQQRCWFGNSGFCNDTRAAAGGLSKVGAPKVVIVLRRRDSNAFAPGDIVSGVDDAVVSIALQIVGVSNLDNFLIVSMKSDKVCSLLEPSDVYR